MSKSIKNDAGIMLLISQHFNNVSVTESDTVFRVTSKERTRLWANMDSVKVQTGTFDIYIYVCMYIYNSKIYLTMRLKQSQALVFHGLYCSLW